MTDAPRFRQDLVAEPIEDSGSRFIDVADPDTGNMFRFYEVEYSLACAMDGERDVAGIVKWAQEELGLSPSANEVRRVIATLGDLGYLDTGARQLAIANAAAESSAEQPRAAATTPSGGAAVARVPIKRTPAAGMPVAKPIVETKRNGSDEADLASGIVVGKTPQPQAPVKSGGDVELGNAGGVVSPPAPELPPVEDLGLGVAGSKPAVVRVTAPAAEDIPLGASGPGTRKPVVEEPLPSTRDMSLDLSDHMAVRPDDVKEAVRASKVMNTVDVPADLLAALDGASNDVAPAKPPVVEKKAEPQKPIPVVEKKPEPPKAEAKPAPVVEKKPEPKPEPKPIEAKQPEKKPVAKPPVETPKAPPAPEPRTSRALIFLLVLVVVGGGGFAVWKFVLNKADETTVAPPIKPQPKPPEPPKPPPPPTMKLGTLDRADEPVTAGAQGRIEKLADATKDVKAGDVLVWLAGHTAVEQQIADANKDIARVQAEVDAATTANDKARIDDRTKSRDTKKQALAAKQAELDKFLIKTTVPGKAVFGPKVAANANVGVGDVVATIKRAPIIVTSFKVPADAKVIPDGGVRLAIGDAKIVCKVLSVDNGEAKLRCPGDAAPGADATYVEPTDAPADEALDVPSPDPANTGSGSGSASGSAAGSGSAGSGSAAKAATPPPPAPAPRRPAPPAPAPHPAPTPAPATPEPTPPAPAPAPEQPASPNP